MSEFIVFPDFKKTYSTNFLSATPTLRWVFQCFEGINFVKTEETYDKTNIYLDGLDKLRTKIINLIGGQRELGIPTVLDRLIQQAIHQVLSPVFEAQFSDSSYGFRPHRDAGQAVQQARRYIEAGHRWVVDIETHPRLSNSRYIGKWASQ